MTVRITGTWRSTLGHRTPEIQDALSILRLAGTLNLQQGKPRSRANPKDTGRMAASWTVGHNTPAS